MSRLIVIRSLPVVALLLAGAIVLILAGSGTVGFAIGLALVGLAAVLIVSVFFYEVGRSEDRDRARERQAYGAPHANGL
jgi:ABC-type transport system involved in cytochrome bd biosynthesis fused ATPase/permease subunit